VGEKEMGATWVFIEVSPDVDNAALDEKKDANSIVDNLTVALKHFSS